MALAAYLLVIVLDPAGAVVAADDTMPGHIYLKPNADRCDQRAFSDEVVVCGSQDANARYRLRPIQEGVYRDAPVRAEMKVGSGKLAAHGESKALGAGQRSNRAMVTLSLPF